MYDWLSDALRGSSQVVTANRRLARILSDAFARQQIAAGQTAWQSPDIVAWPDWLARRFQEAQAGLELPVRINAHHSRILWERCLRREVSDPLLNIAMLVRQARDAWSRLMDWSVPLDDCVAAAQGRDQKIFAAAAQAYRSILDREGWTDDACLAALVGSLIRDGHVELPEAVSFAGFDRLTPAVSDVILCLEARDVTISQTPAGAKIEDGRIVQYENPDAEMRAAGAWARHVLRQDPRATVAVVRAGLEQDAERAGRLVREGFVPGWQTESDRYRESVNVSYGRKLSGYPLIAVALCALRWCSKDIASADVSRLLRSPATGRSPVGARSRFELRLRQVPAQHWSPRRLLRVLGPSDGRSADARDFLECVGVIADARKTFPATASPADWATRINEVLGRLNWPGDKTLASDEFQVVNRWRELLNELARLELVSPILTFPEVLGRLHTLASETVFQPESGGAVLQLLGPLEAAGMQFDALWIAGMTAEKWPPAGRPSPLLSRQLQRERNMPDAEPADTLAYAGRLLTRLATSTSELVCSFALTEGDAEQSASGLLEGVATSADVAPDDPGWYAQQLSGAARIERMADDPVPPIDTTETVSGGAGAIERQFSEPFAAFAFGRLGIRPLYPFTTGLTPNLRGSIIHNALFRLYQQFADRAQIASLRPEAAEDLVRESVRKATARVEATGDNVLQALLALEKERAADLLSAVLALDLERHAFEIVELESAHQLTISGVPFSLRIDRVDKLATGELQLLDYKSGKGRKFLDSDKEPRDMQLVIYAMAMEAPVADLAYINIDTRDVSMDGAGKTLTPGMDWDDRLPGWFREIETAVEEFAGGDVRLHPARSAQDTRSFGLLSRIRELQRNVG